MNRYCGCALAIGALLGSACHRSVAPASENEPPRSAEVSNAPDHSATGHESPAEVDVLAGEWKEYSELRRKGGESKVFVDRYAGARFRAWRDEAAAGSPVGQHFYALCLDLGVGVDKDEQEAATWYRRAAEQGNPAAQERLAACHASGSGVAQDKREAEKWYRKAAEQGFAPAQFAIGLRRSQEPGGPFDPGNDGAAAWFEKAARQGHGRAQYLLALAWTLGDDEGTGADARMAVKWARRAAESDDPELAASAREMLDELGQPDDGEELSLEEFWEAMERYAELVRPSLTSVQQKRLASTIREIGPASRNLTTDMLTLWARTQEAYVMPVMYLRLGTVDVRTRDGATPLVATCFHNRPMTTEMLLELGADPNFPSMHDGHPVYPLHAAAASGSFLCIQLLLNAGADDSLSGPDGGRAVTLLRASGHLSDDVPEGTIEEVTERQLSGSIDTLLHNAEQVSRNVRQAFQRYRTQLAESRERLREYDALIAGVASTPHVSTDYSSPGWMWMGVPIDERPITAASMNHLLPRRVVRHPELPHVGGHVDAAMEPAEALVQMAQQRLDESKSLALMAIYVARITYGPDAPRFQQVETRVEAILAATLTD